MLSTDAIQATMLCTTPTRLHKLLPKGSPRAMQTNPSIRSGEAVLFREVLDALFAKVDGSKSLTILRL